MPDAPPANATAESRGLTDLTRLIQRAEGFAEVLAALKNGGRKGG